MTGPRRTPAPAPQQPPRSGGGQSTVTWSGDGRRLVNGFDAHGRDAYGYDYSPAPGTEAARRREFLVRYGAPPTRQPPASPPAPRPPPAAQAADIMSVAAETPLPIIGATPNNLRNLYAGTREELPQMGRGFVHMMESAGNSLVESGGAVDPAGNPIVFTPAQQAEGMAEIKANPHPYSRAMTPAVNAAVADARKLETPNQTPIDRLYVNVGKGVPQVGATLIDPMLGVVAAAGQGDDDAYQAAKARGLDDDTADTQAAQNGFAQGGVSLIPGGGLFKEMKLGGRVLGNSLFGIAQQDAGQAIQNLIEGKPLTYGLGATTILGAVGGGVNGLKPAEHVALGESGGGGDGGGLQPIPRDHALTIIVDQPRALAPIEGQPAHTVPPSRVPPPRVPPSPAPASPVPALPAPPRPRLLPAPDAGPIPRDHALVVVAPDAPPAAGGATSVGVPAERAPIGVPHPSAPPAAAPSAIASPTADAPPPVPAPSVSAPSVSAQPVSAQPGAPPASDAVRLAFAPRPIPQLVDPTGGLGLRPSPLPQLTGPAPQLLLPSPPELRLLTAPDGGPIPFDHALTVIPDTPAGPALDPSDPYFGLGVHAWDPQP